MFVSILGASRRALSLFLVSIVVSAVAGAAQQQCSTHGAIAINDRGAVIGSIDASSYLFDGGVLSFF